MKPGVVDSTWHHLVPAQPKKRAAGRPDRDVRLLVDHREDLLAERTRAVNRLR